MPARGADGHVAGLSKPEAARVFGEFVIGSHPVITRPMPDIPCDEKIAGSFHFTPDQADDEADTGNRSAAHRDMVRIQTPKYGDGTVEFHGEVIRKDGTFVPWDMKRLNPDCLR